MRQKYFRGSALAALAFVLRAFCERPMARELR